MNKSGTTENKPFRLLSDQSEKAFFMLQNEKERNNQMGTKIVYNHRAIEKKWREKWEQNPVNPKVDENGKEKEKYYCLDMFPYPSGNGLHVGHWRGYVISDVWSRYKLQQGYYIIHPMGWDAFGLPAENYAIKMGVHPAKSTAENVGYGSKYDRSGLL